MKRLAMVMVMLTIATAAFSVDWIKAGNGNFYKTIDGVTYESSTTIIKVPVWKYNRKAEVSVLFEANVELENLDVDPILEECYKVAANTETARKMLCKQAGMDVKTLPAFAVSYTKNREGFCDSFTVYYGGQSKTFTAEEWNAALKAARM